MTMERLGEVLRNDQFTDGEKWIIQWQFRLLGDFETALIDAITRADEGNLMKLALGFPMQVDAYLEWSRGSMGQLLRSRGIDV